jgi:hypothetical protein
MKNETTGKNNHYPGNGKYRNPGNTIPKSAIMPEKWSKRFAKKNNEQEKSLKIVKNAFIKHIFF